MGAREFWKRIWRKFFPDSSEEETVKDKIDMLCVGDIVKLTFRDPAKIGFLDPASYASSRFDPEDFKTRVLTGQITTVSDHYYEHEFTYFEMQVVKSGGRVRKYTFLEDEIEELTVIAHAPST